MLTNNYIIGNLISFHISHQNKPSNPFIKEKIYNLTSQNLNLLQNIYDLKYI